MSIELDELKERIPDVVTPNASREWLADGRIILFTVQSAKHDAIDAWADLILEASNAYPVERPWLIIHNIAVVNAAITPYARKRIDDVNLGGPQNLKGRVAIVTPQSIFARLVRLYVNTLQRNLPNLDEITMRVFFKQAEAEAWLLELFDEGE